MKNLLIATTALVATATVAAADVSFSGYGRFGMMYDGSKATDELSMISRLRLQADMTAASDNGLSFAARYRIQAEEDAVGNVNQAKFSVTAGALTVAAGNICGAIECMPGVYEYSASAGVGLEGKAGSGTPNFAWDYYNSDTATITQGVEAIYSAGAVTVHVSNTKDAKTAAVVSYSAGAMTVAAAYQDDQANNANDATVLTLQYDMGSAKVGLLYADHDGLNDVTVRGSTTMGGATVYGYVSDVDGQAETEYAVGLSYGLGGGTSFEAGVGSDKAGDTKADAGFLFKF